MIRLFCVSLLLFILPSALVAAPPTYTLDKDPVRLGKTALEEGRYADATRAFQEAVAAGYQVPKATYGLAEVAVHEGRLHDAEELYRQALGGAGKFPEAHAGLGLLLLRQERETEAEENITAALAEDANLWPALYGRARLLLLQKKPEEAKKLLDRGSGKKGLKEGEDLYHHGMALYWLDQGNVANAEKEALSAFAIDPADPEVSLLVGHIYELQKTPYLAIQAFEAALAAPGAAPTASLLDQLGRLYEQTGRPNDARDTYLKAVAVDSMYAPALRDLADLLRRGGQPETAARAYLRYLSIEPHDVDALVGLSIACFDAHRVDEAFRAAEKALAEDSTRADAKLAYVRSGLRSEDKAVKQKAATLAALLPDSVATTPEDRSLLIGADIDAGRYDLAARRLEGALASDPDHAALFYQRGILRLKQNETKGALPDLEKAATLEPKETLYAVNLAVAYLRNKDVPAARAALRRALAVDANIVPARILLAQSLMADSLRAAEAEYRKVTEIDATNAGAFRSLGYCQIQRAAYAEAAASYRKAAEIEPRNADGLAGLGSAYLGLKEWAKAETAFKDALAIDPKNAPAQRGLEMLKQAGG